MARERRRLSEVFKAGQVRAGILGKQEERPWG